MFQLSQYSINKIMKEKRCLGAHRNSLPSTQPTNYRPSIEQISNNHSKDSIASSIIIENHHLLTHLVTRSQNIYNLKEILMEGYIREEYGKYTMNIDVTRMIENRQQTIYIDNRADIVKLQPECQLEDQLIGKKEGYQRCLRQCQSLLSVLENKEDYQIALINQKKSLKKQIICLETEIQQLRESKQILEKQLKEETEYNDKERQKLKKQITQLARQVNYSKSQCYQAKQKLQDFSIFYRDLQTKFKNLQRQLSNKENHRSKNNIQKTLTNKMPTQQEKKQKNPENDSQRKNLQKTWHTCTYNKANIQKDETQEASEPSTIQTNLFKTFQGEALKQLSPNKLKMRGPKEGGYEIIQNPLKRSLS